MRRWTWNEKIKKIWLITSPISSINVTFPQLPGVDVWFAEISDPASIKLLIRLHLRMWITSGGHWCCKTRGGMGDCDWLVWTTWLLFCNLPKIIKESQHSPKEQVRRRKVPTRCRTKSRKSSCTLFNSLEAGIKNYIFIHRKKSCTCYIATVINTGNEVELWTAVSQ